MNIPDSLYYTKEHEWLSIKNNVATIGITDYAQSELGDVIYIDFIEIGTDCKIGEVIGTIEAVKTVSDIYTPIQGTLSRINTDLEENPDFINNDPYGAGWIIKLNSINKDYSKLLSADEYKKIIQ